MEVGDVGVRVFDGLVAVPVGVASDGTGLVVVVVRIVVAVFMLVLDHRVVMDVLVRGA